MLIPPRRLRTWTTVPDTATTFAEVVPVMVNRQVYETPAATVVMAYPGSVITIPDPHGVRLDFRWVLKLQFRSFYGADSTEVSGTPGPTEYFALSVVDESPLMSEFLAGFSDPDWSLVFGKLSPGDVLRHFHIVFDDFGGYDVLAVDGMARKFPTSPRERRSPSAESSPEGRAAELAREATQLLDDAMALDPLPPIVSYPIEDGFSNHHEDQ